jgi:hypothetical protein
MSLYNLCSSVLYLHLHCPFSLIGPYIRLRIFFSNSPNLFSAFCISVFSSFYARSEI